MPTNGSEGWDHTDPDDLRELYHKQGKSLSETADACGVAFGTIQYHMDKHDTERRSQSAAQRVNRASYNTSLMYPSWQAKDGDRNVVVPVHRLLAVAEYGYEETCQKQVHHRNGIKWDNRPSNIELMTSKEHLRHHNSGESGPASKLSEADVREIRERYENGETQTEISHDFPITTAAVSLIVRRETWTDI